MSKSLKVLLLMDEAWVPRNDPELRDQAAEPLTERHVAGALRELGHEAAVLGVGEDVAAIVAALTESPPDLVFNLVEQFRYDRRMDKNVAGLLEMIGIPFTGSGPEGLMFCRDKGLCKQVLGPHRIRCPRFVQFPLHRNVRTPRNLEFPLIVKPQYQDASDGMAKTSIVRNEQELIERVRLVHENWAQLAIAEEYVEGRELYVSLLGNKRLTVFPARELLFGSSDENAPRIATGRVKADQAYRQKWNIEYGFAELDDALAARIARVCKRVYRLLRIRDYGRIDLRLTSDGQIKILEANANPDVAYGEDFAESAERAGVRYEQLIDRIVRLALRRYEAER